MDPSRFDTVTRAIAAGGSRRRLMAGLAALGFLAPVRNAAAGKHTKLKRNAFGCVNVGKPCRGKDSNCCSGICQGKKPKKGKKDKSRCVAHDQSSCEPGETIIACGGGADIPCVTTLGDQGRCATTTGNAGYCFVAGGLCAACTKDTDCVSRCGEQAACVRCDTDCADKGGTACVGLQSCLLPPAP